MRRRSCAPTASADPAANAHTPHLLVRARCRLAACPAVSTSERALFLRQTVSSRVRAQVQESGSAEVRKGIHVLPSEQMELAGSKGTANFVMKFDKVQYNTQ